MAELVASAVRTEMRAHNLSESFVHDESHRILRFALRSRVQVSCPSSDRVESENRPFKLRGINSRK